MDKETVKKMISDLIDSADEIQGISITGEVEEIDKSTLDGEWIERRDTGRTNICITIYKEQ